MKTWKDLNYWKTGEWQVIEERLNEIQASGIRLCPDRSRLFRALDACSFRDCRAMVIGQDPYPDPDLATGVAFSVPDGKMSKTLEIIFDEYESDLKLPRPKSGNLEAWASQGVLLWNAFPSRDENCSHMLWDEWTYLTREIINALDSRGDCVFVLLGGHARKHAKLITRSKVIETSHPSPLGFDKTNMPFKGSRIFTRINAELKPPIDWRLP